MPTLPVELRKTLERTCIAARDLAVKGAKAALETLAVQHHEPYGHMTAEQRNLRNKLRAHGRQLGDTQDTKGQLSIEHLAQECAYEHWHRMLFARFLAENHLLMEPDMHVALSLTEVTELAKEVNTNLWTLAGRFAQTMLPEVFRADDPVLQVTLAREDQLKLEQLLDALPEDLFTASDSLGWCYQFWQTEEKETVNKSGNKIGADELPAVTQIFTEDYMVDFLLDNTLGAWWAGRCAEVQGLRFKVQNCPTEETARKACALPGVDWKYLRFVKKAAGSVEIWTPAAGTFDGWPKTAKELKCLDPCMGSGHFVVAMFQRLVALRMAEEKLNEAAAVAAVVRDNLFGLEIDPRCTQIAAFNLALTAWRRVGHCKLPAINLACSGLAPNTREADWLAIAGDNEKLRNGMGRLYRLFKDAPVLGSLINPRAHEGDLLVAAFHELQPLLEKAMAQEAKDDTAHETAVTARGMAKAGEILAGEFTLVATNVPFLGRGKQVVELNTFSETFHPLGKNELSTTFVERCIDLCKSGGAAALVSPQSWLFLGTYAKLRAELLRRASWNLVVRLGPAAFQDMNWWAATTQMLVITNQAPASSTQMVGTDVSKPRDPREKARQLLGSLLQVVPQAAQLKNPDARISLELLEFESLLEKYASCVQGLRPADRGLLVRYFWELSSMGARWRALQSSCETTQEFGGMEGAFDLQTFDAKWRELGSAYKGHKQWGKLGVSMSQMSTLPATIYTGAVFDGNVNVFDVQDANHLSAVWAFCASDEFQGAIRKIDQKSAVTNATFVKVPFDLAHWQKVAAEKYPHGLPKPYSSDPTQWLFNGYPKGADQPLQVALARLLGYQWPRQTGSSFLDCPALGPDGLENLADDDGIVCIPSARGAEPAADRLRKLLTVAFGKDWNEQTELELIRATGSNALDLEEWLRNDFFDHHCDLFHQRPFLWHIWDGRKRDGFHALVNYHKLAGEKGKGRRTLESLTHSYLGDWITRQKDSLKRGEEGADERLAAALALKERLEAIIEGKLPFDIFVRWKPLDKQAIGWEPDINDGVRINIRPFLASDLPNGKKGAGILRTRPNIKWEKDRGNEPKREKEDFPWFWKDGKFTGERVNDVHLTNDVKRKARKV